jgi:ribonuclease HI
MDSTSGSQRFTCQVCGAEFSVPEAALRKYPGWTPQRCLRCRSGSSRSRPPTATGRSAAVPTEHPRRPAPAPASASSSAHPREPLATGDPALDSKLRIVLDRYSAGPDEGVFTDGGSSGNPGPGGWGAVYVRGSAIVGQRFGREAETTNNRMELTALIAGYGLIGPDDQVTIWTDSQLCVNIVNSWAAGWERRGWRRKDGPVKNLELVKEVYALAQARPNARLCWLAGHNGARWNEYVDTLATGHLR